MQPIHQLKPPQDQFTTDTGPLFVVPDFIPPTRHPMDYIHNSPIIHHSHTPKSITHRILPTIHMYRQHITNRIYFLPPFLTC